MSNEKPPIRFGGPPVSDETRRRHEEKIQRARQSPTSHLKGDEPVGSLPEPNAPIIQNRPSDPFGGLPQAAQGGVVPRPAGAGLRPETVQGLADASRAAVQAEKAAEAKKEDDSKKGDEKIDDSFLLDFFEASQRAEGDQVLRSKQRKKGIETRCQPLSLDDLLYVGWVKQKVPVIPEKFEPVFRSLTQPESLFLSKYVAKKIDAEKTLNSKYAQEFNALCVLTCSLVTVTGRNDLPAHLDSNGEVDENAFELKMKSLIKSTSMYVLMDLGIQYDWFDVRVKKLLNVDDVKNG